MARKTSTVAREIASSCLAMRLRSLNRAVSACYDDELRPLGLKASQLNLLVAVAAHAPVQAKDVSEALRLDKSTLSRNVDKMVKAGWLEAERDGRAQWLTVTEDGAALLDQARRPWRRAQARAEALLGDEGTALLRASYQASG